MQHSLPLKIEPRNVIDILYRFFDTGGLGLRRIANGAVGNEREMQLARRIQALIIDEMNMHDHNHNNSTLRLSDNGGSSHELSSRYNRMNGHGDHDENHGFHDAEREEHPTVYKEEGTPLTASLTDLTLACMPPAHKSSYGQPSVQRSDSGDLNHHRFVNINESDEERDPSPARSPPPSQHQAGRPLSLTHDPPPLPPRSRRGLLETDLDTDPSATVDQTPLIISRQSSIQSLTSCQPPEDVVLRRRRSNSQLNGHAANQSDGHGEDDWEVVSQYSARHSEAISPSEIPSTPGQVFVNRPKPPEMCHPFNSPPVPSRLVHTFQPQPPPPLPLNNSTIQSAPSPQRLLVHSPQRTNQRPDVPSLPAIPSRSTTSSSGGAPNSIPSYGPPPPPLPPKPISMRGHLAAHSPSSAGSSSLPPHLRGQSVPVTPHAVHTPLRSQPMSGKSTPGGRLPATYAADGTLIYGEEGTPMIFSKAGSLSSLSFDGDESNRGGLESSPPKLAPPSHPQPQHHQQLPLSNPQPPKMSQNMNGPSVNNNNNNFIVNNIYEKHRRDADSSDDDDEDLLKKCISSGIMNTASLRRPKVKHSHHGPARPRSSTGHHGGQNGSESEGPRPVQQQPQRSGRPQPNSHPSANGLKMNETAGPHDVREQFANLSLNSNQYMPKPVDSRSQNGNSNGYGLPRRVHPNGHNSGTTGSARVTNI